MRQLLPIVLALAAICALPLVPDSQMQYGANGKICRGKITVYPQHMGGHWDIFCLSPCNDGCSTIAISSTCGMATMCTCSSPQGPGPACCDVTVNACGDIGSAGACGGSCDDGDCHYVWRGPGPAFGITDFYAECFE